MKQRTISIALLGHGTVGRSVYRIIQENHDRFVENIRQRTGQTVDPQIIGVLVSDLKKHSELRPIATTDPTRLLEQDVDILIELIGGQSPATELMTKALSSGIDVVSANKQAIFSSQGNLEKIARDHHVSFHYEAAVAGAIPILRSVKSLVSGRITKIEGILNGSTNYILTQVAQGVSLDKALQQASDRGFLEADPSSDVDGFDAMYKLGILTYLATGRYPGEDDIERVGITGLSPDEIEQARLDDKKYKLIASADFETGRYSIKPVALESDHDLYRVDGALNGISLWHEHAGGLFFQGAGAGGDETASAVVGDLIDAICLRILRCQHD